MNVQVRSLLNFALYGFVLFLFLSAISSMIFFSTKHEVIHYPAEPYAYGNWFAVGFSIIIFSFFVISYLTPLQKKDWRTLGIYEAFIIALFTEMYGFPLTIFILTSIFGVDISFGHVQGHLGAVALSKLGVMGINRGWALVMAVSNLLILAGLILLSVGWREIHGSRGELVTDGVYSYMRHPQYTGIFLITTGFLVQWPTIITVLMWPVLVLSYYRLAKKEEELAVDEFDKEYKEYAREVPMFFPKLGSILADRQSWK